MSKPTIDRPNIAQLRARFTELQGEAAEATAKRADLILRRTEGRSGAEMDALAQRLIAGAPDTLGEREPEIAQLAERLVVIARAMQILDDSISLDDLREGHRAAAPKFAKAVAHVKRMARALDELERIQREASADVDAFELADSLLTALEMRHSGERPEYNVYHLVALKTWRETLLGDGYNPSRLERWREGAREDGLI